MIVTSLDLELNQPSNRIIQVGACVGNLLTGEILDKQRIYVKIEEPLSPYIITLTGITEDDLAEKGVSLRDAYSRIAEAHRNFGAYLNPLTWGGGDSAELRNQLGEVDSWCFGRRWLDVKTVFQVYCMANGIKPQSGLAKSMTKIGMRFQGRKHDAMDDSVNTFRVASALQRYFLEER